MATLLQRLASIFTRQTEVMPRGFVVPFGFQGTGAGTAKNYRAYVEDGFWKNPIIYACLNTIAETTATVRFDIEQDGEIIPLKDTPTDLVPLRKLITRPNPNQAIHSFIEEWSLNINIGGSAYIHQIGLGFRREGEAERALTAPEMWLIRPDQVRLIKDGMVVVGFLIQSKTRLTTEEMFYTAFPNAWNDAEGLGALKPADRSGDSHTRAILWNDNLLKNMAVPSGLAAFKGIAAWTKSHFDEFIDKFQQKFGGPENAGKTFGVPADGLDYTSLSHSPKDMDWLGGKQDTMRDICAALGVPSILLGDPNSRTFSNYREGRKALYTEKVLPDADNFTTEFNHYLLTNRKIKPNVRVVKDVSHIDVLREDENDLVDRLSKADWMTPNEKRDKMGLPEVPGGNTLFVPFNLAPAATVSGARSNEDNPGSRSCGCSEAHAISPFSLYQTEEQRQAAFDRFDRKRRSFEEKYDAQIRAYIEDQIRLVATNLIQKAALRSEERDIDPNFAQLQFDFDEQAEEYVELMRSLQTSITIEFGQDAINQLIAEGVVFDVNRIGLDQFIANDLASRSRLINQTTADRIQQIINAGVAENEGVFKIRDRLLDSIEDLTIGRARTIAQSEVGRAANIATQEAFTQMGVQQKEWLSSRDDRVRDTVNASHVLLDGTVVGLNDNFVSPVSGASGPGPTRMNNAAEDINCRCILVPLAVGEEPI